MEFSEEVRDHIKQNMLHITTNLKRRPRNYLNKQLQDAVCNYFLENYAAVFLKEDYQIISGRELRKKIERGLPSKGKKYINLLNKFKSEILRVNKGDEYRYMLSSIIYEEDRFAFESEEWCTLYKKKILALLLLVHWDQENILNFYDMWNAIYPNDPLIKYKLSKEEKEKKKCLERGRAISDSIKINSSIIDINDYNSQIQIAANYSSNQTKITLYKKIRSSNDFQSCMVKDEESVNYIDQTKYPEEQILNIGENDQLWQIQQAKEDEEVQNYINPIAFTYHNNYQKKEALLPDDLSPCYYKSPLSKKFIFSDSVEDYKFKVKQEEMYFSEQNLTPFSFNPQEISSLQTNILYYQDLSFKKEEQFSCGLGSQETFI